MNNESALDPEFLVFEGEATGLPGFLTMLRQRVEAKLDFEADINEGLDGWIPFHKERRAPSKKLPQVRTYRKNCSAWLHVRVFGPREGKEACAVISYHAGSALPDAGSHAAERIELAIKEACGDQTTIVRIALDSSPETAYQVVGDLPPFASLLRYRNDDDSAKAAAFWKCDAGADAGFLWYPSAGHDTRPLSWFLPRTDIPPRANVDYFVLSGLGELTFEQLVHSTLRNGAVGKVLFKDRVSRLSVIESVPFFFDEERVLWYVGDSYTFRDGNEQPVVRGVNGLLIRTKIESRQLGTFEQNLVYVEMENSAFEMEVVKQGLLNPVVYCAVTDGCGFGGNRRCENDPHHIERFIETRTFSPAWWVTDHVQYLDETGGSRSYRFNREVAEADGTLTCNLTASLRIRSYVRQFGVGFMELFPGRLFASKSRAASSKNDKEVEA